MKYLKQMKNEELATLVGIVFILSLPLCWMIEGCTGGYNSSGDLRKIEQLRGEREQWEDQRQREWDRANGY